MQSATVEAVTANTAAVSGKVDFYAGENFLGSGKPQNGVATISKTFHKGLLDDGPITARYQGDKLFNASTSTSIDAV